VIDVQELFRRQTEWQKKRQSLTWAEKIRMVEAIRESILELRGSAKDSKPPKETT
jgi:hypothetical protein